MLWNRPPTMAAKCITWVGLYFSNKRLVACKSLKKTTNKKTFERRVVTVLTHSRSASFESVNIHRSSGNFPFSVSTTVLIALPTSPDPPVTRITLAIPEKRWYTYASPRRVTDPTRFHRWTVGRRRPFGIGRSRYVISDPRRARQTRRSAAKQNNDVANNRKPTTWSETRARHSNDDDDNARRPAAVFCYHDRYGAAG